MKRGDFESGIASEGRPGRSRAEPRTLPRDRPECSDARQSTRLALPARPPRRRSFAPRPLGASVWRCRGDSPPPPTSFAPGRRAGRCRRSTSSTSTASRGGSRRSPARSSSSISGPPGASRAGSRCRRSTRWRRGAAARASSSPPSTTRKSPDAIRRFLERAPFKSQILLDADGDATVALDAARLSEHRAHRPQRRAGARRRRRARLGRRRGQGAARSARRCRGRA